jgi:uncharacterized protein (TIGR02001 family)
MAATVLAGVFATTPAFAQDAAEEPTPDVSVTGSVTLVSDYRFRGVGLSGGDIAIQGGLTLNSKPGIYFGTWASSLEDSPVYGEVELDVFAGWTGELTDGLGADVGVTYYAYPSKDTGAGPSDVWEFYGKLKPTFGPERPLPEPDAGVDNPGDDDDDGGGGGGCSIGAGVSADPRALLAVLAALGVCVARRRRARAS